VLRCDRFFDASERQQDFADVALTMAVHLVANPFIRLEGDLVVVERGVERALEVIASPGYCSPRLRENR
jgi:hypothetical protein